MKPTSQPRPCWDKLYAHAEGQAGYFTTAQALRAGYSSQLLLKHLANGRVLRVRRSIYRLVHFPTSMHENLVVYWLWSKREGVFSHETALMLHGLAEATSLAKAQMTVPAYWRRRRMRVPEGLVLHIANDDETEINEADRVWCGPVPVTSPRRTLLDCASFAGH